MRVIVFIDGQNLYHLAKNAWSSTPPISGSPYGWPSYDVEKLAATLVATSSGRTLPQIRFYTGVPNPLHSPQDKFWQDFWSNKLRYLGSRGVHVYRGRVNPGGQEKGVDVSLGIDIVWLAYERQYDAAIIVSQDWDFGPAVKLAKRIASDQGRFLTFESAFPYEPGRASPRGVPGTKWIHIDKSLYDSCFDPTDYRVS